ncbi:MAG: TrkH family potassium uptake protein, partial [Lachnospiraceae bacterium]|nr:TrkH family potassium uptake protein [Lachnospiraceae bacterium]
TARTAGFNTIDLAKMSHAGLTIMIILMLIGGSPGSTAGGMKTTTIAVLVMSMIAVFKQKENTDCFGRRIEDDTVKHAAAIFMMYILLFMAGTLVISMNEDIPFLTCMFEAASAIGTVGVTLGITPGLGTVSHIVLILLMFLGRVGGLTLIYATVASVRNYAYKLPKEKIMVG